MKKYIGVKVIKAEPMTGEEYFADRTPGKTPFPTGPGYVVVYPNAQGSFNGPYREGGDYVSWSPADVFEAAYLPANGPQSSRESALAVTKLEEAIFWIERGKPDDGK